MNTPSKNRFNIHLLWLSMILLTFSSYLLGRFVFSGTVIVSVLLLTAFIKGYFIISDSMELREVSLMWRVIIYGWLWVTTLSIAAICIFL